MISQTVSQVSYKYFGKYDLQLLFNKQISNQPENFAD